MFCTKFDSFLAEYGLSIAQLSKMVEIPSTTMYSWQKGVQPTADKLVKLADFFGCTTDELLGRVVAEPTQSTGHGITPLENKLLQAFRKLEPMDQNRVVGIVQAFSC